MIIVPLINFLEKVKGVLNLIVLLLPVEFDVERSHDFFCFKIYLEEVHANFHSKNAVSHLVAIWLKFCLLNKNVLINKLLKSPHSLSKNEWNKFSFASRSVFKKEELSPVIFRLKQCYKGYRELYTNFIHVYFEILATIGKLIMSSAWHLGTIVVK